MMSLTMPDDQVSALSVGPRVMMVVPKYPYPVVGGLERQSHELAKALLECGIQVQALSGAFAPSHRAEESVEGVRVHRIPWTDRKWLRFLRTPFDLFFALSSRRRSYDVIHVHQFSWFGLFAIVSGRLLGKRILTKLANVGPLGIPGMLDLPFGGVMLRIMRLSDALVAMSQESISEATGHAFPLARMLATPNGIRLCGGPGHATGTGSEEEPCKVVFVGRLSPEKGLEVLLRCWPDVKQAAGRPILLEIWGSGPLEEELRRLSCELGIPDSVIFRGHVDGVRERLKSMDIFVLNSLAEGNSNSILEAMAAGLPIVSTRVGGTAMLVGPEGSALLFDPGDHAALVGHLIRLIRDPALRNATADAMRRRVAENFDIRRVAETYAQAYRYLVSGKRDRISELSNPVIREDFRREGSL